MQKYLAAAVCSIVLITMPGALSAQAVVKTPPRKYDKLLTAVESFAKLNEQIAIREKEYAILVPFVEQVKSFADQLQTVCDMKCYKSYLKYRPKLVTFTDALYEAHRRYQAMTPNITERNNALMNEIHGVANSPEQLSKEKYIAALNQLNLENVYHYKAYNTTYHSADKAMVSLSASSDLTTIINSFASTTDRLVKINRAPASMNTTIQNLKTKAPDIRARIKALEDRRKSLVCTATLNTNWTVDVKCTP